MRSDLHIHTTASDGAWSPEEVVRGAAAGGLHLIAITDHDTASGYSRAAEAATAHDVQVLPAVEVSSTFQGRDVHVLGYFVDPTAAPLREHAEHAGRRREERMREMIERLVASGVDVTFQAVEAAAGPEREILGRPHLAQALVQAGHVASVHEAFQSLIGDEHDAFVPTHLLDPVGAIEVVKRAGGVPVWAHPPGDLVDALLPLLIDAGLLGLEVYRPRHKRNDVLRLEQLCRSTGLMATGGSDWHGPEGGSALGDFFVTPDEIEGLLTAGGM